MKIKLYKFLLPVLILIPSFSYSYEKTAIDYYNEATICQNKKMWFDAVDLYREALLLNPQFGDAWFSLAKCSYALGSYDLCIEYSDKAALYFKDLSEIKNLKGFALISLGKTDDAKQVFNEILSKYPNNIDARFGLAELDLLYGKISDARDRYKDALKRDEKNRKALLSLALVSSEMGRSDIAEKYISQALTYHSGEAEVHYLASYLAMRCGNYDEAEIRARSAVQINSEFDEGYAILASVLYAQKRWEEVIDICDFRIGRNRNLHTAWFMKGRCLDNLGRTDEAIETYEAGLGINPYDEIMRQALETLISDNVDIEDDRRDYWASYHFDKAVEYGRNYNSQFERFEYQKALSVAPLNLEIRQSFAEMLERDGLYELYLHQLKFIRENEVRFSEDEIQKDENSPVKTRNQIKNDDAIEAFEKLMSGNISSKWGVDPFYLDKIRWSIGIYFTKSNVQLFHNDLEEIVAYACKDAFNGVPTTAVDVLSHPVKNYGEAFKTARSESRDYFIIIDTHETERTFSLDAKVYSGRTGKEAASIHVYRTGNDCVARAIQRFRQGVLDILPIRGKVLQSVQGTLLLDLGKSDGVSVGSKFDVVKNGCVNTKDSGLGVDYAKKDLVGTVVIIDANEEISEGEYKKNGFYDTLNPGDEIVLTAYNNGDKKEEDVSDVRPQADMNGNPSTDTAREAEREAIKESLKPASRENDLIHLIRSILY